jgi:Carboxypeptidase regulatory-like domain
MKRLLHALLLSLLIPFLIAAAVAAQSVARITGTVRDDTGKPVLGATITATNPDQAPSTFTATTDEKGRFGILGLRRGTWVFAIAAPGFQTTRATGLVETGRPNPPLIVKLLKGPPPPAGPTANLTGTGIQTMIDAAESAAAAGDVTAAVSGYRALLLKVPALTTADLRIGALLEQKGDAAAALEAYRELARVEPGNAGAAAAIARLTRAPR